MLELLGVCRNITALRGIQIVDHAVVEREQRCSRTNFCTHVADRCHTRAREGLNTRTVVLDDRTSTTLDRENTSNLEDNIYKHELA